MTPGEILASLFPAGHDVHMQDSLVFGTGRLGSGTVHVLGAIDGIAIGADQAIRLAGKILDIAASQDGTPILVLVDTSSQQMSRRDELLGLSEFLAHLAKSLMLAEANGHRTIGLLYGGSAAGAFIATASACDTLIALPGAHPQVMDLPSMARVTKLPIEVLEAKARVTSVFAPGLENLAKTGAIAATWDPAASLADQLSDLLAMPAAGDDRAALGHARGGRPKAAVIAAEIEALALAHG